MGKLDNDKRKFMSRPKVAVASSIFRIGGGSEGGTAWILEALKEDYTVYFITMDKFNRELLNEAYGTDIKENEVKIIQVYVPGWLKSKFALLRWALLVRFCKRIAAQFDLMISGYNIMDFGKEGIQYIVDFSFNDRLRCSFDPQDKGLSRFFYRNFILRRVYLKLCQAIARTSKDAPWINLTITNSEWCKKILMDTFGVEAKLILRPVVAELMGIPWEERENGFISLSRVSPEKNIDKIINILSIVRKKGYDIHLHILGSVDDANYYKYLKRLTKDKHDWIFMEGLVIGKKKNKYLSQHKFGISARQYEPFGIAIAEMVKSGCIVWVPDGGGQRETVGHPELVYTDIEDAAHKIAQALKNEEMQLNLRNHLREQGRKFYPERFMAEFKGAVDGFLKNREIQ